MLDGNFGKCFFGAKRNKMNIALCPEEWPELTTLLSQLSQVLVASKFRPRVDHKVCNKWKTLLDEWVEATDIPLFVRKHKNNRGARLKHESGRIIIPADKEADYATLIANR
jgi:hypothetical protein